MSVRCIGWCRELILITCLACRSRYRRRDGTNTDDFLTHPWWAERGYASVRLDIAGSGDSDGLLLDEYLASEQADLSAAIGWIAEQSWCTGAVGMVGISWGGFAALQVAACRPPALKAIIPCCATDDRWHDDVHYMGGCLLNDSLSWGAGIFYHIARWPDVAVVGAATWRAMWLHRLEQTGCPLIEWTRHQRRDQFWRHGSVRENYSAIAIPTFVVGGWTDGYSNALLRLMQHLPHSTPTRALIGPWTHVYPHFGTPGAPLNFLQETLRWWDCHLKGDKEVDPGAGLDLWMGEGLVAHPMNLHFDGKWIHEATWPPLGCEESTYVLTQDPGTGRGVLATTVGIERDHRQNNDSSVFRHCSPLECGLGAGEWCPRDGGGEGPEFQADQRVDDAHSLTFDVGTPLTEPLELLGAPIVTLRLSIDQPLGMIAVRLNEVKPDGASSRVTFGLLNLAHRNGGSEYPTAMVPGMVETVKLRLNDAA